MSAHVPILLDDIFDHLIAPFTGTETYVDCTLGGGGHLAKFLEDSRVGKAIGVDQDPAAIERAKAKFSFKKLELIRSPMSELDFSGFGTVGAILADLGFSSDQLDDPSRGLSFREEGPLDMRMNPDRERAYDYLMRVDRDELSQVLKELGEERFHARIASRIVEARDRSELEDSTKWLSRAVVSALPAKARHGRIHAATRSFQAIRMRVNHELDELDALLRHAIMSLMAGGRLAVMSFHSLEDRKVKWAFKSWEKENRVRVLTKKPIVASEEETASNPRARSAKLRVLEKL